MRPDGVLETCLYARDLEAAKEFYASVLGLELIAHEPGRHVFFRSGTEVFLVFNPDRTATETSFVSAAAIPPHGSWGAGHAAFRVQGGQLAEWRRRLADSGVSIESEVTWPGGGQSLYVRDPAGNSIELATPEVWADAAVRSPGEPHPRDQESRAEPALAAGSGRPDLLITRLEREEDARACARLMAMSEPWLTLGRSYEQSLHIVRDDSREVYLAHIEGSLAGFLILCMTGAFVGYVQTVCVASERRGRGLGSALIRFAEERILREAPNVFMCVSSFNTEAMRLYRRLGYEVIGELRDYIVAGHSEILLRKTSGPLSTSPRLR